MPDARDVNAHYHIAGEGFSGETATASHRTTGTTINSNAGASRTFGDSTDFVSGPLDPGVWEAVFYKAQFTSPILFAQGATAALATPTAASAIIPHEIANNITVTIPFQFIVPKGIQYIGFLSGGDDGVVFSLRKLHAEK